VLSAVSAALALGFFVLKRVFAPVGFIPRWVPGVTRKDDTP